MTLPFAVLVEVDPIEVFAVYREKTNRGNRISLPAWGFWPLKQKYARECICVEERRVSEVDHLEHLGALGQIRSEGFSILRFEPLVLENHAQAATWTKDLNTSGKKVSIDIRLRIVNVIESLNQGSL